MESALQSIVVRGSATFLGPTEAPRVLRDDAEPEFEKTWPNGLPDRSLLVGPDHALENVFIYIAKVPERLQTPPPPSPAILRFKSFVLEPRVQGIHVGQRLEIHNDDSTMHNSHAVTRRPQCEPQPPFANPQHLCFDEEEVFVRVVCDVHKLESAFIAVLPHPYFAVTDSRGICQIAVALPPGTYTLSAVHELLGTQNEQFTVGAATKEVDLSFEFKR